MKIRTSGRTLASALTKIGIATAFVATTLVVPATAANALYCPPPFHTLPGCDGGGGGGGGTNPDGWMTETIAGMSVHLYTPTTEPALGDERALMISLHGCAQTSTNMRDAANWKAAADEYGMIVALPAAPNGGVYSGCWDYYDANHSRTAPARHDDNLLDLAAALKTRESLNIDADQVYISGLSSGGGQAMVMGCLAPDVFAGVGINAGPTVGTTAFQIGSVASDLTKGKNTCVGFAGTHAAAFGTQLTSVVYGSNDSIVAPGYNTLNAQIAASIYGAPTQSTFALSALAGNNTSGSGTLYSDAEGPRVSLIQNTGLGHNWPAGAGAGGTYISAQSIDYPAYVTEFFFDNNRRAGVLDDDEENDDDENNDDDDEQNNDDDEQNNDDEESALFCGTATNAAHQAEGRTYSYGVNPYNPYFATGSGAYLGLGDDTVSTLQETAAGSYAPVASCPAD